MNIILNNGTVYNAVSANFGETQPNGTKTYTALIYADDAESFLTDIVKGDFTIQNESEEQVIQNMERITSYMVNKTRGTVQVWLEEVSEVEKKLVQLKDLQKTIDEQALKIDKQNSLIEDQENVLNNILFNILPDVF